MSGADRDQRRRRRRLVDEVFFEFANGRISRMWGLEDTWERLRQLGQIKDGC